MANFAFTVKFDNQEQLPPILNALETDNGGNKLILEVAVRTNHQKPD
jgi:F0F1-type ATP synthase beta subunit